MRIEALGWIAAAADDGTDIELGGPLERRLLAALASRPGEVLSLDALADAVFGEDRVDGVTIRLQNHVSRLRKRLGGRTIVTSPAGYRLDIGTVDVDWLRFEELVSRASEALDPDEAVPLLAEALSSWRGTPFSDLEDWPAVLPLVRSLDESRRAAEENLVVGLLASGRAPEAVTRLEALVVEEPLRERRWALLMKALVMVGQTADALRAYQEAHRHLAEIGLEPSAALRELERAVAAGDADGLDDVAGRPVPLSPHPKRPISGTVTFLFTDIEGSTQLWETSPDDMERALARHDMILRGAVEEHTGVVFSTGGDGLAAAFGRAADAVLAAVDAQRRLQVELWPEAAVLRVRMGLHTGEAQERDGDFFGPPVNRAARIMAAAHGGQIVLSGATTGVLGPLTRVEFVDLGEHRLRGVGEAMRLYAARAEGTAWNDEPLASLPELRRNLPRPLTTWFGEPGEVTRLVADLSTCRLVTLTGAGGVGKTRMAVEAAWLVADRFPDGVWFLDLAPVTDATSVAVVVASSLAIAPQAGASTIDTIVDWLQRRRVLIVVDNCEHLLASTAEVVAAVALGCDTVTILATSREPLGVSGERVVPVRPLATRPAVDLFCDRARAADAGVEHSAAELDLIATICDRVDGLPLAVELVAARIRSATPAELLARLDDRSRALDMKAPGAIGRHHTLRASVNWSYDLLADTERLVFDRIAVFAGTFDASAAAAVTGVDIDHGVLLDVLDVLVDKSMLVANPSPGGTRHRLLEPVRQFAAERLERRGEAELMRDRHLVHYRDLAERTYRLWSGPGRVDADARFDLEWDNLRAAHQWALATLERSSAERLVKAVHAHAQGRMRSEVGDWAQRTLDAATPESPASADLFGRVAHWKAYASEFPAVLELAERGVAAATGPEDPDTTLCRAFEVVAMLATGRMDRLPDAFAGLKRVVAGATDLFVRYWGWGAICLAAPAVDPPSYLIGLEGYQRDAARFECPFVRGGAAYYLVMKKVFLDDPPDHEGALRVAAEGLREARRVADRHFIGQFLLQADFTTLMAERPLDPRTLATTLDELFDTRNWIMTWVALECAVIALCRSGNFTAAARLTGYLEPRGLLWAGLPQWSQTSAVARRAASAHDPAGTERAQGDAMTRDEVVAFVLSQLRED